MYSLLHFYRPVICCFIFLFPTFSAFQCWWDVNKSLHDGSRFGALDGGNVSLRLEFGGKSGPDNSRKDQINICLSIYLSIHPFIHTYIHPSIHIICFMFTFSTTFSENIRCIELSKYLLMKLNIAELFTYCCFFKQIMVPKLTMWYVSLWIHFVITARGPSNGRP